MFKHINKILAWKGMLIFIVPKAWVGDVKQHRKEFCQREYRGEKNKI